MGTLSLLSSRSPYNLSSSLFLFIVDHLREQRWGGVLGLSWGSAFPGSLLPSCSLPLVLALVHAIVVLPSSSSLPFLAFWPSSSAPCRHCLLFLVVVIVPIPISSWSPSLSLVPAVLSSSSSYPWFVVRHPQSTL